MGHTPDKCRFKNETCHRCRKVGHISRGRSWAPQAVESQDSTMEQNEDLLHTKKLLAIRMAITIESQPFEMEQEQMFPYLGRNIPATMEAHTLARSNNRLEVVHRRSDWSKRCEHVVWWSTHELLLVVTSKGPSLFGKDWLEKITLNWKEILQVLEQHWGVFLDSLGMYTQQTSSSDPL